jgi:senataxin
LKPSFDSFSVHQELVRFFSLHADSIQHFQKGSGSLIDTRNIGKTTMTVAIICRYILESKALGIKRKLLVCGPTNKSVVVLARKVLHCIKKDDSTNVVLIGDGDELLSDNRKELEKSFVFTYIQSLTRAWRRLTDRLLKDNDFNRFEDESGYLLSKMRKQIPTIRLRELETALMYVGEFFEESADGKDQGKSPTTYLKAIAKTIRELDQQMVVQDLLNSADVIFCTLSTTGSLPMRRMEPVSDLIVDEASASTEPELMIPLHTKPDKLLLVGDPRQLPATVKSPVATKFGLGQSLQERLMFDNRFDYTLLDVQYRMRPEISEWPMAEFYNEKVKDGDNVTTESYRADIVVQNGDPYTWVQVSGKEQKDIQFSTFNESEAQAVAALLLELKEKHNQSSNWFSPDKIRIITFYQAQVDNLRLLLRKYQLDVMVSTVDGSQGCEADIVILSFVRGTSGHMGFLKDNRRLNVVLTRAKFQLVCVGNAHAVADLEEKGGNIVLRKMATDALSRSDLVQAPSPLPPPPKRAPRKDNPKAKKVKNKKAKKKSKSTSKSQPEKIIEVDSV